MILCRHVELLNSVMSPVGGKGMMDDGVHELTFQLPDW